jgi:flavin reductase (DIM6/NTAB) family NADH-FMN oxidoreductase RutF
MRKSIKKIVFGKTLLPQEFTLGLPEPQTEITVWLHGAGAPIDVTYRHAMVCAAPLVMSIGFDRGKAPDTKSIHDLSLKYCERESQRLLGEIGLELKTVIQVDGSDLLLFEPKNSTNYCISKLRIGTHYLFHTYQHWRRDNTNGIKMTFLERRASMVMFITPHPIVLASVGTRENGNLFPMNLLGDLGNGYFGFGLRTERVVGDLIKRAGHCAVSSIPLSHGALAYQLAHNHTKQSIDWNQIPFETMQSTIYQIPVPAFAPRVREIEIKVVHVLGSHCLFVGRVVHDEKLSNNLGFCSIHGFYQAWRLKGRDKNALKDSLAVDELSKWGRFHPLGEQNEAMRGAAEGSRSEA